TLETALPGGAVSPPPISARTPRARYEAEIAPRPLLRVLWQKLLHGWARGCIPPGPRNALYRAMGITVGHGVFIGLDTWLDDHFPELIVIEDEVVFSFRVTVVVHDDARRMDAILPGQRDGTVAPVILRRGCYLGAGCLILPGVTVGERA